MSRQNYGNVREDLVIRAEAVLNTLSGIGIETENKITFKPEPDNAERHTLVLRFSLPGAKKYAQGVEVLKEHGITGAILADEHRDRKKRIEIDLDQPDFMKKFTALQEQHRAAILNKAAEQIASLSPNSRALDHIPTRVDGTALDKDFALKILAREQQINAEAADLLGVGDDFRKTIPEMTVTGAKQSVAKVASSAEPAPKTGRSVL